MAKHIRILEKKDYKRDNKLNKFIDIEPYMEEKLGSDSYFIVDQRLGLDSIINLGYEYINKHTNMEFFEIRDGDLDNYTILYRNY